MQHEKYFRVFVLLFIGILIHDPASAQSVQSGDSTIPRKTHKIRIVKKKHPIKKLQGLTSDQLIKAAKFAAFKQNNYPKAKALLLRALKRSPNYADVKVFLGRLYGWTDNYDSAKMYFEQVLTKNPKNEDASVAYADLEYYLDHNDLSLAIVNAALKYHPKSKILIARKRKVLAAIKNPASKPSLEKRLGAKPPEAVIVQKQKIDSFGNQPVDQLKDTTGNQPIINTSKETTEKIDLVLTNQTPIVKPADVPKSSSFAGKIPAILDTSSSDDLIILARKAAFDEKNYEKAKGYLYQAYNKSPTYADVQIFLGRIYTWTNKYDSARFFFDNALRIKPDYEDAINAYSDMEFYDDHYPLALALVESGLRYHPQSEDLLLRKAKFLLAMKDYKLATVTINELLKINYKNAAAIELRDKIKELSVKNDINVAYDFSYFSKQFDNPWHLIGIEYGRVTDLGKIIARVNLANRFSSNGAQFEMDAYPHISKTFYAYLNFGVPLTNNGIFPIFRAGFSLYANLPAAFEGELGFRYLKFSGNPVIIYTASLGKYVKNWLFNEKVYLVPSDYSHTISASFTATASYYIGGASADDVVGGSIGYGISPDDRANNIQLNTTVTRLGSYKLGVFYKRKISKFDVFSISQGVVGTEYLPGIHSTEYQFGLSITHKF